MLSRDLVRQSSGHLPSKLAFWFVAVILAVLLLPSSGWANASKNCPTEPGSATIISGETYIGSNCVLKKVTDQDLFTFNANAGDTWDIVAESANVVYPNNICFALHDPKGNSVTSACSSSGVGVMYAPAISKLTSSGVYTIVVYEGQTATVNYGISIERISPSPGDGTALTLGTTVNGKVNPPSAQEAYTFYGTTTGKYQVTATMTSGAYPQNLCFTVFQPGGASVVGACTSSGVGQTTIQANVTPAVNGTYVITVYTSANDDTLNFSLNVTCVSAPGTCGNPPPQCALKDALSYNSTTSTLTMNFTLATPTAATWNAWLTTGNSISLLWSVSQPVTEPAITIPQTQVVAKSGKVGVLSTLTTPKQGITCSNFATVSTGTP